MDVNDVDQCYKAYQKYRSDLKNDVLRTHPALTEAEFDSTWLSEFTAAQFGLFWARVQQDNQLRQRWVYRLTCGYVAYKAVLKGTAGSGPREHRAA